MIIRLGEKRALKYWQCTCYTCVLWRVESDMESDIKRGLTLLVYLEGCPFVPTSVPLDLFYCGFLVSRSNKDLDTRIKVTDQGQIPKHVNGYTFCSLYEISTWYVTKGMLNSHIISDMCCICHMLHG